MHNRWIDVYKIFTKIQVIADLFVTILMMKLMLKRSARKPLLSDRAKQNHKEWAQQHQH